MTKKVPTITLATVTVFVLIVSFAACDSGPGGTIQPGSTVTATTSLSIPSSQPETPGNTPEQATGVTTTAPSQSTDTATTVPSSTEQPVAQETSPAGDIPDTQAFVLYSSASGGYELEVPEGWARTETSPDVTFVDKLDGVMVTLTDTPTAPTTENVQAIQVAALQKTGRAVQITSIKDIQLPVGPALLIEYTSNSEPNEVTGKQVRLENNAYLFYKEVSPGKGKLATLTLWAPLGADNVDQWQRMSRSFKWR